MPEPAPGTANGAVAEFDTRFSLPAVNDPPDVETGVILMGLDADRLLAGLGLTSLTDEPALVALAMDHLRHGVTGHLGADAMVVAGAERWRAVRAAVAHANRGIGASGSPRQAWRNTTRALDGADLGPAGPGTTAYLAACWLRHRDVDRRVTALLGPGATGTGPPDRDPRTGTYGAG
ncbi:MAG TPA: DUF6187 family protein [Pseudonocardiaceae bacterium]